LATEVYTASGYQQEDPYYSLSNCCHRIEPLRPSYTGTASQPGSSLLPNQIKDPAIDDSAWQHPEKKCGYQPFPAVLALPGEAAEVVECVTVRTGMGGSGKAAQASTRVRTGG